MTHYSTIIADDELPALRRLKDLIESVEWLECVGEAVDGSQAIRLIREQDPHIALLDIRMPGVSGLEVVETLQKSDHPPHIIFTTAYDRYAVTAFELHAVDYLLKPFSEDRFRSALDRARQLLESGESSRWQSRTLSGLRPRMTMS